MTALRLGVLFSYPQIRKGVIQMKEIWYWIQAAIAAVGGWLGYFLGGWDGFLYALLAFVVIDYITGLMCAVLDKKLSSEVGFRGIFKKVLKLWLTVIDKATVGRDGTITFKFKNGTEITE